VVADGKDNVSGRSVGADDVDDVSLLDGHSYLPAVDGLIKRSDKLLVLVSDPCQFQTTFKTDGFSSQICVLQLFPLRSATAFS